MTEKMCPSKQTITRTILLTVAIINNVLTLMGKSPFPFDDDQITEAISYGFTAVMAIITWWKNNSFTQKAIKADEEYKLG